MNYRESQDLIYDWNERGFPFRKDRKVTFDDETLRDGLQSPSVVDPDIGKKIEILHLMDKIGIENADIGLPGAGPRAVADVTEMVKEIDKCGLKIIPNCAARTMIRDIEPIVEIRDKTGVPIVADIFLGCSQIRQYTEEWDIDHLLKLTNEAVTYAVENEIEVMYVTEDTTRAHPQVLARIYREAINCGARRITIADTVGHATPFGAYNLVSYIRHLVDSIEEDVKVDWHGHRDRGLSIANSVAAYLAGADQIHGTCLGVGERCGNTPMEMLLVNFYLMGIIGEGKKLSLLKEYVEVVSEAYEIPISHNYPVFGDDAFETATGVHAAAVIKAFRKGDDWLANRVYSGVPADEFGMEQKIRVGPMSGKSNVIFWLEERNIEAEESLVEEIFSQAKSSNKLLTDEEILAIVEKNNR